MIYAYVDFLNILHATYRTVYRKTLAGENIGEFGE